jgi:tetratricopeptide (TPR) repeat protein
VEHFRRAVEIDSTFALAAIAWADAGNNSADADVTEALDIAWRQRDRLDERDLRYLRARTARHLPDGLTRVERVSMWTEAVRDQPDRAFSWYHLGDRSFHTGEGRGEGWLDRVRGIFQEALDRDPTQGAAIMHLYFVDAVRGDIEDFRRSAIRMAAVDTAGWNGTQARVMLALTNPDTTGFGDTHATALERGVTFTYLTRFPGIVTEGWMVSEAEHGIEAYLTFGRPNEANEILSRYEETVGRFYHEMRLMDAARGALSEDLGLEAAQAHEQQLRGKAASDYTRDDLRSLVRLALWHLARGDTSRSERTIGLLRTASSSAPRVDSMSYQVASLFLEADLAERRGHSQAKAILVRMWPDYDAGVPLGPSVDSGMHFALAELYERLGDPEQALAILERETVFNVNLPQGAEYLRERGRLSALLGDTERATREYRQYLLLRHNPEPELSRKSKRCGRRWRRSQARRRPQRSRRMRRSHLCSASSGKGGYLDWCGFVGHGAVTQLSAVTLPPAEPGAVGSYAARMQFSHAHGGEGSTAAHEYGRKLVDNGVDSDCAREPPAIRQANVCQSTCMNHARAHGGEGERRAHRDGIAFGRDLSGTYGIAFVRDRSGA